MTDYTQVQVNPEIVEMNDRVRELEKENQKLKAGRIFGVVLAIGSVAAAV